MRTLFLTAIIAFFIIPVHLSYSSEGSFDVCSISSYSIRVCETTNRVILACTGEAPAYFLKIVNPDTLQVENTYNLESIAEDSHILGIDSTLLVLLSELDGDRSTPDGKLVEIDYSTGLTLRELPFNHWLNVMATDVNEGYAYISCNIASRGPVERHPRIMKVCLSSFQIMGEVIFGSLTSCIKLSPDGSKLFVNSRNIYPAHPSLSIGGIGIFDTSDMSVISRVALPTTPALMEMSADGSELYIASTNYLDHADRHRGAGLYIVCTQSGAIIEKLRFYHAGTEIGTYSLAYDAEYNKLYGTVQLDPIPDYPPPTNMIIAIDLDDYSYGIFEMGENPIGRIVIAQSQNGPRLFARERRSPVVHYKDVKCLFNQDPICILEVVTPMPYQGSLPAAITFDASNSYDPDGHEITYHWDFNGDGIFDGLGDEYTGDPWNPTHEFTSYGIHVVMLKVMDECDGECVETVVIEIIES